MIKAIYFLFSRKFNGFRQTVANCIWLLKWLEETIEYYHHSPNDYTAHVLFQLFKWMNHQIVCHFFRVKCYRTTSKIIEHSSYIPRIKAKLPKMIIIGISLRIRQIPNCSYFALWVAHCRFIFTSISPNKLQLCSRGQVESSICWFSIHKKEAIAPHKS